MVSAPSGVQVSPSPSQSVTPTVIVTVNAGPTGAGPFVIAGTGGIILSVSVQLVVAGTPTAAHDVAKSDAQTTKFLILVYLFFPILQQRRSCRFEKARKPNKER
ncbi:unnamed protein product [Penicillium salamii]|uniref:Uncharacterized protein n=1 Tax=Penicillium salamii TaxID=1612424 RepID=A0A9W4NDP5_9EURO|nr:unnamed protein product [Penicillium salamii]CAG8046997.1 unnamed protein product [Penicillium salamii]CAG8337802.1 unnamed protein product [Penicillium salamii]CAG8337828.1 unnamed protein product [Penicillium salamii]CAG8346219.1 unnamed protein product [Penicillium salamii]